MLEEKTTSYSLRELGRISHTDHNQLWMYENSRRNPQPRVIRRLASGLWCEAKDLLKERGRDER